MLDFSAQTMRFASACTTQIYSGHYLSILLVIRGTARFHMEQEHWACGTEDLFLLQPEERALLDFPGGPFPLEVLWVRISMETLRTLSSEKTDLASGFHVVPFRRIVVHTDAEQSMHIRSMVRRMVCLSEESNRFGSDLYAEGLLKLFTVSVLRACIQAERHQDKSSRKHLIMDDLLIFIHAHITEEITLERLEREFYISRYHIAREFKRQTGQTVHSYIVKVKLNLCRQYIERGYPITEACRLGGFGGYNHFFQAFKREYGMTPKQYYRLTQQTGEG